MSEKIKNSSPYEQAVEAVGQEEVDKAISDYDGAPGGERIIRDDEHGVDVILTIGKNGEIQNVAVEPTYFSEMDEQGFEGHRGEL